MRLKCNLSLCPHKPVPAVTHIHTCSGLWRHQYLVHCRDFSFFYFLFYFLRVHKKHKNANKPISNFFPITCFLSVFFIFVHLQRFVLLLGCLFVLFVLLVLLVLLVRAKSFCEKNKEFKTVLITSFILLILILSNIGVF